MSARTLKILILFAAAFLIIEPISSALASNHVRPPASHNFADDQRREVIAPDRLTAVASIFAAIFSGGLFVIALIALIFARRQVVVGRRQTEVGVLIELESRWNSDPVKDARQTLSQIRARVTARIDKIYPDLPIEERKEKIQKGITICFFYARRHKPETFREIIAIMEFFESMGVFVYVLKGLEYSSVANLFGGVIEAMDGIARRYMEHWRKQDSGAFQHALTLFDDTREWLEIERTHQEQFSSK